MGIGAAPSPARPVPRLDGAECQVWWAGPGQARPGHRALLNAVERARADAYARAVDRDRFTVGCALSRLVLGGLLDMPAAAVSLRRECGQCGGPHGRPRAAGSGLELSVTHSGGHVGLAVTAAGPVGLDVERIDARAADIAASVATENERRALARLPGDERPAAFFRFWTRKEAALKAVGTGLRVPMAAIDVSDPQRPVPVPGHGAVLVSDLDVDDDHAAALAVGGTVPLVRAFDAGPLLAAAALS